MKIFRKIRIFGREMVEELKKASWPNGYELRKSSVIVLLGVLFLGLFVSMVDFSLFQMVDLLIRCVNH
ncbi:MAG: preprotein translocase subunit SecE [Puniceicoccales bacterium]|jgi:preprotein translocase SecE subunit|nr:preprotein translocase subunit SecE [Puniceicoccales bacterium]